MLKRTLQQLPKMILQNVKKRYSGPKKPWQPQTQQDSTRFSPLDFSLLSPGEKRAKKSSGEPPVETAPRNCRFLSLVVVELVLRYAIIIPCTEKIPEFIPKESRFGNSSTTSIEFIRATIYRSAQGPGRKVPPGVLFQCFWAPGSKCPFLSAFVSAFWRFWGLKNAKKHSKRGTWSQVPQNTEKALRGALSGPGPWALL